MRERAFSLPTLLGVVATEIDIGDQMRRNRGERHCAHLRITGHLATGVTLCAEVLTVGRAVGRAQRGAVHRPQT